MTIAMTLRLGDVVEVGGMRGVIQSLSPLQAKVASSDQDEGIWVPQGTITLVYRPGEDTPHRNARVLTKSPRTGRRSTAKQDIDPLAHEVIVELPATWNVTNFQQRGDNTYVVLKKAP